MSWNPWQGSNAGGTFDGLVENNIMSVAVNYRLGGLGFFHLKQAETEGHGCSEQIQSNSSLNDSRIG